MTGRIVAILDAGQMVPAPPYRSMTMDDNIKLPPVPLWAGIIADAVQDYARDAVLADRERRAKQEAKPVVRSVKIELCKDGTIYANNVNPTGGSLVVSAVTLRWTADGRAWIDSERNRELARRLRIYPSANYNTATAMSEAADALDGGER